MALSHTVIVVLGATVITAAVLIVLLIYLNGRQGASRTRSDRISVRLSKLVLSLKSILRKEGSAETRASEASDPFMSPYEPTTDFALIKDDMAVGTFTELYRRIGSKQKLAGVGFVVASVIFLVLSLPLKSVVLEIDSVISFAVAAILFLKENRERVQARVLNAVVLSLATTISGLSSRTGSRFLYSPEGRSVSDVTLLGTPKSYASGIGGGTFNIVPPGMGLAKLFLREAGAVSPTPDALGHLLPSVINENFGLAQGVEVNASEGRVEVLLRKPAIYCSCQKDEPGRSDVVGCTVSSFLAILYSFGTKKVLSLDRCETDDVAGTWKVSMNFMERAG